MKIPGKARHGIAADGRRRKHGFTLLEMAVVLIIIGVITGIIAEIGTEKVEEAREIQTTLKMDKIEDALYAFVLKNGRLPCPAMRDATQDSGSVNGALPTDPNYGVEAQYAGRCASWKDSTGTVHTASPTADYYNTYTDNSGNKTNLAAEGGVPFVTLGLTSNMAYDGWGRHFTYAAALRYTETEAFDNYDIYDNCAANSGINPAFPGLITVNDINGNPRSTMAAYALISHGENGHGAFTFQGKRYSSGSQNTAEQKNCNCTQAGVYNGSYSPVYVQEQQSSTYDDIVRFKERWQLQSNRDRLVQAYNGPEVMVGLSAGNGNGTGSCVQFFAKTCDIYTPLPDPASPPLSPVLTTAVSPDNQFWAVGGAFSVMIYTPLPYAANGTLSTITQLVLSPNPFPTNPVSGMAFSYNSDYDFFAISYSNATPPPNTTVALYQVTPSTSLQVAPSSTSFAVTTPPLTFNSNAASAALAFHPSGAQLLIADAAPATQNVDVYSRSGLTFTQITPANTPPGPFNPLHLPAGTPSAMAFSPDGSLLALGEGSTLEIYQVNLSAAPYYTYLTTSPGSMGASINALSFDRKGRYLAVGTAGSGNLYVYRINPSVSPTGFTLLNPSSAGNSVLSALFSPRQNVLFTGENTAPSAKATRYIPGDEYFLMPPVYPVPTPTPVVGFALPAGTNANSISARYPVIIPVTTLFLY